MTRSEQIDAWCKKLRGILVYVQELEDEKISNFSTDHIEVDLDRVIDEMHVVWRAELDAELRSE